jgi:transposase
MKGMNTEELFRIALGLAKPWTVTEIAFSEEKHQLDLHLDFPAGSRFACPECKKGDCPVHDTEERTWRHLNFFQHQTYLHARQPRVKCPEHGVKTVEVPWARPQVGFTLLMEAFILALVEWGMTPAQVARMIEVRDKRIWRVLEHYVDKARAEADYSQVKAIGVDETSRRRGHHYISVFMDLEGKRVMYATEGKDAETVQAFKEDLQAHGGKVEQIEEACLDMSPAFIKGLTDQFPKAHQTFDPFHLMKLVNEAVDEVRRQEQKDRPELTGTRYVWLKNTWNHTRKQQESFEALRSGQLKTVRAHHMKCVFQDIMGEPDRAIAEDQLLRWRRWAARSRLGPMVEVAGTFKKHWAGVVRWFTSRISNGLVEGINSLIQTAKRKARGFRSTKYLITMVYLIAGKLKFNMPTLGCAAHTK